MPTWREPFGIVFVEAMAHALPIVSTRVAALPELVVEGESGFLVEPGDAARLADRLVTLLTNAELRRREMARHLFEEKHNWQSVFSKIRPVVVASVSQLNQ